MSEAKNQSCINAPTFAKLYDSRNNYLSTSFTLL